MLRHIKPKTLHIRWAVSTRNHDIHRSFGYSGYDKPFMWSVSHKGRKHRSTVPRQYPVPC